MSPNTTRKALLILGVLAAGAAGFFALASSRRSARASARPVRVPTVEVRPAAASTGRAVVTGSGTVVAARTLSVVPQVGGRVVHQHPALVPGGRVKAGETLLRLDRRDHQLAVEQQQASVKRAELELESERARQRVAESEWALMKGVQPTAEGRSLALREVHVETAQVALASARSALSAAKLNLSRTKLTAPFDALVVEESVEVGQVVSPGAPVARLVASDAFWVRVGLPTDRLPALRIPALSAPAGEPGSRASVLQPAGGEPKRREARIVGLLGDLDGQGRLARLLVEVREPLAPAGPGEGLPLLLGSYVLVELEGPTLDGLVELPRGLLHEGSKVWVARDGRLSARAVEVAWRHGDVVHVRGELLPGDPVVESPLAAPVDGMAVRVAGAAPEAEPSGPATARAEVAP